MSPRAPCAQEKVTKREDGQHPDGVELDSRPRQRYAVGQRQLLDGGHLGSRVGLELGTPRGPSRTSGVYF